MKSVMRAIKNSHRFLTNNRHIKAETKESDASMLQAMCGYSLLKLQFIAILSIATTIATLGLIGDSAVAIVGAMLIAPLMKPILAFAFAAVSGHIKLQLRSFITLLIGCIVTLAVGFMAVEVVGLHELTTEILSRTKPSLIDLGIATAAGLAAAMASVRSNVSDTLPGVAIAVALLPPLCASAICISVGAWQLALGSLLLFSVNLVAIISMAMLVFWLEGYGTASKSWPTFLIIIFACIAFFSPLNYTMRQLKYDDLAQQVVEEYLHKQYKVDHMIHPDDLSQLKTVLEKDHLFVFIELKAPIESFDRKNLKIIHTVLSNKIKLPINLKVQFLITKEFMLYTRLRPDGSEPDYGVNESVPRR